MFGVDVLVGVWVVCFEGWVDEVVFVFDVVVVGCQQGEDLVEYGFVFCCVQYVEVVDVYQCVVYEKVQVFVDLVVEVQLWWFGCGSGVGLGFGRYCSFLWCLRGEGVG